ncbi:MAG: ankyrin repeat domain-containing protein [Chlamydiae bacterium]|nr:ankyrin repeat domain-containing protein [Chlamydiota bacterium]
MSIGPGGHVGFSALGGREKPTQFGSNQSEQKIQWVVLAALGNLEDINNHLGKGTPISPQERSLAIKAAARNGFEQVMDRFLAGFEMPEKERIKAIKIAAEHGQVGAIDRLLSAFKMPEKERIEAIKIAAEHGQEGAVNRLLTGFELPGRDCVSAVKLAAENGNIIVIERLLQETPINPDDLSNPINYAFLHATQKGHNAVVEWLLEKCPNIDPCIRGRLVTVAAEKGLSSLIERLLQNGGLTSRAARGGGVISRAARGEALRHAAIYGHLQVIQRLLQDEDQVLPQFRGQAIVAAAANGHLQVIQRLLQDEDQVLPQFRGEAIVAAAANGHCEVVPCLMRDSSGDIIDIEEEYLFKALDAHKNAKPEQISYNIGRLGTVFLENSRALSQDFILYLYHLMDQKDGVLRIPIITHLVSYPLDYLRSYCERGFPEVRIVDPNANLPNNSNQMLFNILFFSLEAHKLLTAGEDPQFHREQLPVAKTKQQEEALFLFGQLLTYLHKIYKESDITIEIPSGIFRRDLLSMIGKSSENMLESTDCSIEIKRIWKSPQKTEEQQSWKQFVIAAIQCIDRGIGPELRQALVEDCASCGARFFEE